jgi:hypothetical protein
VPLQVLNKEYGAVVQSFEDSNILESSCPDKHLLNADTVVEEARSNVMELKRQKLLGCKGTWAQKYPPLSSFYNIADWYRGKQPKPFYIHL